MRRGQGTECGVPSAEGGLGEGEGRQVVSSYVFQHGMFCVEFRVLVHHASISGVCVGSVRCKGCVGCVGCTGVWAGKGKGRSSVCAVTRFSTSLRAPLRERFCPCTHGSPRRPPHADARNWGRHRSLPPPLRGQGMGWEGRRRRVLRKRVGKREGWWRMAHRRWSAPLRTQEAS